MVRFIAAALVILGFAAEAHASDPKPAKLRSCSNYTVATTTDGAHIGVCGASKPGGKVTYLRSFQVVKVVDPTTDKPATVMVGFE